MSLTRKQILARVTAGGLTVGAPIGLMVWAYFLGTDATRSLTQQQDSAIGVWVSDPQWRIAPRLKIDIPSNTWTVELASPQQTLQGSQELNQQEINPGAEALVIVWGPEASAQPTYPPTVSKFDFPAVPAGETLLPSLPAGTQSTAPPPDQLKAQVFQISARDFYQGHTNIGDQAVFDIATSSPPGELFAKTPTGYVIDVPDLGPGVIDAACPPMDHRGLSNTIQNGGIAPEQQWFGQTCPTPPDVVDIALGPNEHLDSSLTQQKDSTIGLTQEWKSQPTPTEAGARGHLGTF